MISSNPPLDADLFLIEESGEERMNRVDHIRRSVADGSYKVPATAVADAVVAFFSRAMPAPTEPNPGSADDTC